MDLPIEDRNEYLAAIIEFAEDAIIGKDLDGTITVWNREAERVFGYSSAEMTGRQITLIIPEDRLAEEQRIIELIRRGERVPRFDTVRVRKDGRRIDVSIAIAPIKDRGGRVIGASKTVLDISERKREEERFRLVVEASLTAIIVLAPNGRIRLVNPQTEALFGYSRAELIGERIEMLIPERFRAGHEGLRAGFLKNPSSRAMGAGRDLFGLRKNGTEVPIEIGLNPVQTDEGTIVLASIIDISERKRVEDLLARQRGELERSNRDLEQFAYIASHDLQEPLRAVAGCVQLLQKHLEARIDDRAAQYISHVIDGCHRMRTLIDDLLTFSRIGRTESGCGMVDCRAALAAALGNLSAAIEEGSARITSDDTLPVVSGVMWEIVMLFQNLVGNAIKFRRADEAPVIRVSAVTDGKRAVFSVTDNGIGIRPEYFGRIFDVFQRLHTRNEYPGTGIGLALCKRIVERRGGTIWVESVPGEGSTFRFSLLLENRESAS